MPPLAEKHLIVFRPFYDRRLPKKFPTRIFTKVNLDGIFNVGHLY